MDPHSVWGQDPHFVFHGLGISEVFTFYIAIRKSVCHIRPSLYFTGRALDLILELSSSRGGTYDAECRGAIFDIDTLFPSAGNIRDQSYITFSSSS
jgi:hypothetical protein